MLAHHTPLKLATLCATMAWLTTLPHQAMAAGYTSQMLSPLLLGAQSFHQALGPSGAVVGTSLVNVLSIPRQSERAVLWPAGSTSPRQMKCLATSVPAHITPCLAQDINRSGQIVGWSAFQGEPTRRAVWWSSASSAPQDLSAAIGATGLNGQESVATHLNDDGLILGLATAPEWLEPRPFVWQGRQARRLADPGRHVVQISTVGLNRSGLAVAVGMDMRSPTPTPIGLVWHPDGRLETIEGFTPRGLSDAGHVVGRHLDRIGLWHQGVFRVLPATPGVRDLPETVNSLGLIGGQQVSADGTAMATTWDADGRAQTLNSRASPPSGYRFVRIEEINDAGQMAVTATSGGKVRTVVLSPRP
jgi:uncharacterized membrane protein